MTDKAEPRQAPAAADSQPLEHLRRASAALNDIPTASLDSETTNRLGALKRELSELERTVGLHRAVQDAERAPHPGAWDGQVTRIDQLVAELLSGGRPSGAAGAIGTSGTTAGAQHATTTLALHPTAQAKLQDVRRHVAAFAAAVGSAYAASAPSRSSGGSETSRTPSADAFATSPTTASAPPTAESAAATTSPTDPTPSPTGTSATGRARTAAVDRDRPEAQQPSEPAAPSSGARAQEAGDPAPARPGSMPGTTVAPGTAGTTDRPPRGAEEAHREAAQHIEAIQAILDRPPTSASATGVPSGPGESADTPPAAQTLDASQVQEIRRHLHALRRVLSEQRTR